MSTLTAAQILELRAHTRYTLGSAKLGKVTFASGSEYPINDISYSGLSILVPSNSTPPRDLDARLQILDESATVRVKFVHHSRTICGFCFEHEDVSTLVFLRNILEPMRCARSLMPVTAGRPEGDRNQVWRGDGATHLSLNLSKDGAQVESLVLKFREGSLEREFRYKLLTPEATAKSVVPISSSGGAQISVGENSPNRKVIRHAGYIMLGVADEKLAAQLRPVIEECCHSLAGKK